MVQPIASLPDNAYLPESAHPLADEWRATDQLLKETRKAHQDAIRDLQRARSEDAAALKDAALTGAPLPDGENEKAALQQIEDTQRRVPHLEAELDRIGKQLVVALRGEDSRRHLTETVAGTVRPALAAYLDALAKAERMVQDAHRTLSDATAALPVIESLDTGSQVVVRPVALDRVPSFGPARQSAAQLAQRLHNLDERKTPRQRHVLLTDGRNVTVARTMAADFLRDGIIADWLDGWPAEEPSRSTGGTSNIADHFRENRGHFVPRGERDDAA